MAKGRAESGQIDPEGLEKKLNERLNPKERAGRGFSFKEWDTMWRGEDSPGRKSRRRCTVVHRRGKVRVACGGVIENVRISEPFTMQTPIGGPGRPPVMEYAECQKCGLLYRAE